MEPSHRRPPTHIITFRVPRTIAEQLRRLADEQAETQASILRRMLRVQLAGAQGERQAVTR